ncbi:hypothetical protein COLO4_37654 [Corchorus olitorius]|uniref:Uncharacterized protein n=1 Tax=Corchorus olitorius TaxID=93759 RepID=A0A1R3G094_9ROSI|nr:hypothetical protein COLO4_37654 [Corchorus olitorius]
MYQNVRNECIEAKQTPICNLLEVEMRSARNTLWIVEANKLQKEEILVKENERLGKKKIKINFKEHLTSKSLPRRKTNINFNAEENGSKIEILPFSIDFLKKSSK